MLDRFTAEDFAPLLESDFEVRLDDGAVLLLRLCEIGRYAPSGAGSRPAPFSLVFEAGAQRVLPQRIYRVTPPGMAAMDLFLVPVGKTAEGVRYEAVFN